MNKILRFFNKPQDDTNTNDQNHIDLKRNSSCVHFIHAGHPLYDNIVSKEENKLNLLAPNETAYNETSLIHTFVAIIVHDNNSYLLIKSFKHFKEQSIGGLLQFDETIYNIIPFFENEEEYKTANEYFFRETYEYDHPIENYAFLAEENNKISKITLERGKKAITVSMIDEIRNVFERKLNKTQIDLIDYIIMPALSAYNDIQKQKNAKDTPSC